MTPKIQMLQQWGEDKLRETKSITFFPCHPHNYRHQLIKKVSVFWRNTFSFCFYPACRTNNKTLIFIVITTFLEERCIFTYSQLKLAHTDVLHISLAKIVVKDKRIDKIKVYTTYLHTNIKGKKLSNNQHLDFNTKSEQSLP